MNFPLSHLSPPTSHRCNKMALSTAPYELSPRKRLDLFVDTTPRFFNQPSSSATQVAPWSASALFLPKFHSSAEDVLSDIDHSSDEEEDDGHSLFSHTDTISEIASIMRDWEVTNVLDPTSLESGPEFSCLACLGEAIFHSPASAFEEMCWSDTAEDEEDVTLVDLHQPTTIAKVASEKSDAPFHSIVSLCHSSDSETSLCTGTEESICPLTVAFKTERVSTVLFNCRTSAIMFDSPSFSTRQSAPIGLSPQPRSTGPPSHPRRKLSTKFAAF
ncbi:hypothetical protein DL96DRAFT_1125987 [Flagelloscypha sp. PMI_526]|nr:hypothetical protein DL96DRAFT_1125987 [Flagelloscypha sp. PMI_526]